MRALAFDRFTGPLTVRDLPDPVAPAGGAVVAVEAAGLCRSDWHAWMGHDDDVTVLPHVPGHEFAGTVVAVGAGVDRGWQGRRVTAPFVFACGRCGVCRGGDGQVCPHQQQPGFTLPGAFAEQVVVTDAETNLVALPDDLDSATAAGLGCRVATAYRAVHGRARVSGGEWVVVIGCGGLGLATVAIAAAAGGRVVAVDVDDAALTRSRQLGAAHTWQASAAVDGLAALPARVRELTEGGAHVALDCLGSPQAAVAGIQALRRRGRHIQVGLLPPASGPVHLPMGRIIGWELDVLGSHGMAAGDYPALLAEVATGRLDLAALRSPRPVMSLEEAAEALPAMGTTSAGGIQCSTPGSRGDTSR